MTALRQRLIEDMQLRNFSPHSIEAYVRAVAHFAKRYGRSPDSLSGEQVREYLLYLVKERQVSWSLYNQTRCALQFFYRVTLGRDEWFHKLPCAKRPRRLPEVLSAEELRRLFEVAAHEPKHKALLMVLYGAGLRISDPFSSADGHREPAGERIRGREWVGNVFRGVHSRPLFPDPTPFPRPLHAVPRGFMRIRHFGFLANRVRTQNLETCRRLLAADKPQDRQESPLCLTPGVHEHERCPICGRGRMISGPNLSPVELRASALRLDSS